MPKRVRSLKKSFHPSRGSSSSGVGSGGGAKNSLPFQEWRQAKPRLKRVKGPQGSGAHGQGVDPQGEDAAEAEKQKLEDKGDQDGREGMPAQEDAEKAAQEEMRASKRRWDGDRGQGEKQAGENGGTGNILLAKPVEDRSGGHSGNAVSGNQD
jgi:hypothetical protein